MNNTKDLVYVGIYAAIIYLGVFFLKIQVGEQMIHIGNSLVIIGVLLLGLKKGVFVATISLALYDILNGYASSVFGTIAENIIICLIVSFVFEKIIRKNDSTVNLAIVAFIAALSKVILKLIKYSLIRNMLFAGLPFQAAFIAAFYKIIGTYGTAIVTVIAVPLLYPIFKKTNEKVTLSS